MTAVAILPPFDQQKILIVITETITLNYVKNPPRLLWISEDPMSDQSIAHSTHPAAGHPAAGHTRKSHAQTAKSLLPGLLLTGGLSAVAFGIQSLLPPHTVLSPLIIAIVLGMAFHNTIGTPARCKPGVAFSLKRSEEHTSELQSLMRISSAVFC